MIKNDDELLDAVETVNENLQLIQDYLGKEHGELGRLRFSRNYLRQARHFRKQLSFVSNETIRDNLAYASI